MKYRHKKRGTVYRVAGTAGLQIAPETIARLIDENPMFGTSGEVIAHALEKATFVVYADENGTYVREHREFDGRFEEME
jgi:hypothetical protein